MKVVRIDQVSFDSASSTYAATATVAGPFALAHRHVSVAGHRDWSTSQVVAALKSQAEG